MITGFWCDLHRGTAIEVQAFGHAARGVTFACTVCLNGMADESRWALGSAVGPPRKVNISALRRLLLSNGGREERRR